MNQGIVYNSFKVMVELLYEVKLANMMTFSIYHPFYTYKWKKDKKNVLHNNDTFKIKTINIDERYIFNNA